MSTTPSITAAWILAAVFLWSSQRAAAVDSFRIIQMASSQDGFGQIVQLEEVSGQDNQHAFSGLKLSVTNRAGITKTFEFPADLPSAATAHRHVTIAAANYGGATGGFKPDFNLPHLFLPTDGGTIELGGIDRWTFDAIPTDGRMLKRDIGPAHGTLRNFAGATVGCCGPVFFAYPLPSEIELTTTSVVEYYNAPLDTYFNSGSQPDIDALETGRTPGWRMVQGGSWFLAAGSRRAMVRSALRCAASISNRKIAARAYRWSRNL